MRLFEIFIFIIRIIWILSNIWLMFLCLKRFILIINGWHTAKTGPRTLRRPRTLWGPMTLWGLKTLGGPWSCFLDQGLLQCDFYPKKVKVEGHIARDKKVNIIFKPVITSLLVSVTLSAEEHVNTDSEYIHFRWKILQCTGYIYQKLTEH